MNPEVLRKIGLTDGEIRVYKVLVKLGKSSTGNIMKGCSISSSKIYLILDRLIQKGFVTYTIESNVKQFHAANPINIIEYLNKQQRELEQTKQEAKHLVSEINSLLGSQKEETAKVYRGKKSMLTAFQNILDELKKKEEFYFIGAPIADLEDLRLFFQNLHARRIHRKITTKGIADSSTKTHYKDMFKNASNIQIRFKQIPFPHAVGIGTKRVVLSLWQEQPIGFEIVSERIAQRYRTFFKKLWR